MSIFYSTYEPKTCSICGTVLDVSSSEIDDRQRYSKPDIYVCYSCRRRWFFIECDCGAQKTTFPQGHYSWCKRYKMDHDKEIIRRIKEYKEQERDSY